MIATQIEEMWAILGKTDFTIIEYGAGTGLLCRDILNYLKNNKVMYNNLNYCIIEKSPAMREKEKAHLCEKVSWHSSIQDIPHTSACVLSNEVLDNFAVHPVIMQQELMEVFVDYNEGFHEVLQPASPELHTYLEQLQVSLPKGFRTEINLEANHWIQEIAQALKKGFVITIDYGYPSDEFYRPYRSAGTLLCYNKHQVNTHPYQDIGRQDITAHVNFSALQHWGAAYGLDCCGLTSQTRFMLDLGLTEHIRRMEKNNEQSADIANQTLMLHTFLMEMGNKFKVLVQQKDEHLHHLSGLRLAQFIQ
ncbi:class I SAM-dependent methyltransferase [Pedobacter sp. BS3]|uniref:class I SAM-dependent methyltransferase n=1 Tax=Pedobacter sp. BS3 TaxID=2567937 RepID=UPI0018D677F4|nr:class I SAM-dependent methyltransferase [Pedobacter sp. BS3]